MSDVGFDPYDPAFVADPYPVYERLRSVHRSFHDEAWGVTFFTRHADVSAMLRDRRFGRDVRHVPSARDEVDQDVYDRIYPPAHPTWTAYVRDSFIDLEPPDHTRIRRLVQHAFGRRASDSYRPRIREVARQSVDSFVERGTMDAVKDFATPVPLRMISDLLGVPEGDQPQLVSWSHDMVRLFDSGCTESEAAAAEAATRSFVDYLTDLTNERRAEPTDDLLSALIEAEADGDRLSEFEVVATAILVLNAGHEATVQAIGNGLIALFEHPDQYRRLHEDPSLAVSAAEELLRYDTPLQMFERWVLEDMEWDGIPLRAGSKVGLLFGSANRDEAVFDRPADLDITRSPNPHVSFGAGVHHCVGAPLARVEMEEALGAFAAAVPAFTITTSHLERVPSLVFRGVKALPIALG